MFASSTYLNLFDKHPPFQIDGNFGITAAIAEMLVQSNTERIHLLPALPTAWANGSVKGLCVKNAAEVDIYWKNGILEKCTIRSKKGMVMDLKYEEVSVPFKWNSGEEKSFVWNEESRTFQ